MAAMDLLGNYESDDEVSVPKRPKIPKIKPTFKKLTALNTAPQVEDDLRTDDELYVRPGTKELVYNPTAEHMWAPIQGPSHPKMPEMGAEQGLTRNAVTGFIEPSEMDNAVFEEQYHQFLSQGYAFNPDSLADNKIVYGEMIREKQAKEKERAELKTEVAKRIEEETVLREKKEAEAKLRRELAEQKKQELFALRKKELDQKKKRKERMRVRKKKKKSNQSRRKLTAKTNLKLSNRKKSPKVVLMNPCLSVMNNEKKISHLKRKMK